MAGIRWSPVCSELSARKGAQLEVRESVQVKNYSDEWVAGMGIAAYMNLFIDPILDGTGYIAFMVNVHIAAMSHT